MLSSRPLTAANSLASGGQAGFPIKGAQASSAAPLKAGVLGCKSVNVNSTCGASGSSVVVMGQPSKGMPLKVVVEQQHQAHQHQGPAKASLHAPQHPPFKVRRSPSPYLLSGFLGEVRSCRFRPLVLYSLMFAGMKWLRSFNRSIRSLSG